MDLVTLHARTVQVWLGYVDGVQENQWDAATPCTRLDRAGSRQPRRG